MEKVTEIEEENQTEEFHISPSRFKAVRILNRYDRSDSYIDKLIARESLDETMSTQDKALLNELVNGVIRWRGRLDWVLTGFYFGDYQKCLNIVKNAMRIGLYQILFLNKIPLYAAINESVEITKKIQGEKTAGIVNGVLRNIARNIENIRYPDPGDDMVYYLSVIYSHPKWMVKRWMERFGEENTIKLLEQNNKRPYVPIRINKLVTDTDSITEIFNQYGVEFSPVAFSPESLLVNSPKYDLTQSDLFKSGKITIQDPAASLVAKLASPGKDSTVLDLCAAPGGKSFLLAEIMENTGKIYALDKHESKLRFIVEGAERLGLTNIVAEAADSTEFKLAEAPDLILADVPCSGMGTLSKKPDIKWKREMDDITVMVDVQRKLLENAAELLKPGGVLVYSTCTTEPEENEDNVSWFLANHPEFELDNAGNYLPEEICDGAFYRSLPHIHGIDGAFAARLIKKS